MNELRKQFEVLPDVARIVSCDEIKWCNVYNWYRTDNTDANSIYHVAWLNGAWYAFQEQQKKLDAVKKLCSTYWLDDDRDYNIYIQDIEEILK